MLRFAAAAMLLLSSTAFAQPPSPADAEELMQVARDADARWNARDAEGMAALYDEQASMRFHGRDVAIESRAAVREYFTASFAQLEPGLVHRSDVLQLTLQSDDVVLADNAVRVMRPGADGSNTTLREFSTITVLARQSDGSWKIRGIRVFPLPLAVSAAK